MTTTVPRKTIADIPDEILNHIFELVVIHREPTTGEQLRIRIPRDIHNAAKVCLPASGTCKRFMAMIPMFFGLNTFEIVQRTVRRGWKGPSTKKNSMNLSGLKLLKSGWTSDRDPCWRFQHSIYLPPSHCLHLIKNVIVKIKVLPNIVDGNPRAEQKLEMIGGSPSWLFVIKELVGGVLSNLDLVNIHVHASKGLLYDDASIAMENRELARDAVREYVEAQVPKIGAKKVVVKYSGDWGQYF